MIYGDNPQKINEREDALGLKTHSYAPQITAVMQSGNLYVYGVNNPVLYRDPNGNLVISALGWVLIGAGIGATVSAAIDLGYQFCKGTSWNEVDWSCVLVSAGEGALSGALGATGARLGVQVAGNAFIAGAGSLVGDVVSNQKCDWSKALLAMGFGTIAGVVGGPGLQKASSVTYSKIVSAGGEFGKYTFTYNSSRLAETMAKEFLKGTVKTIGVDIFITVIGGRVEIVVKE